MVRLVYTCRVHTWKEMICFVCVCRVRPGLVEVSGILYTVPLMLVRTLPVTGTCPYEPNRCPCYGYHALSGRSKLLPVGCLGVLKANFLPKSARYGGGTVKPAHFF